MLLLIETRVVFEFLLELLKKSGNWWLIETRVVFELS